MSERLQKLIAQAGLASRRTAEKLILDGKVTVNGKIVTGLGSKADPAKDHIKVSGRLINPLIEKQKKYYVLVNKPRGFLSAAADQEGRPIVTDLVKGLGRLFPVGRLDFNSEGLILLTNDGDFANYISSSKQVPKVYVVKVKGIPPERAIARLRRGIRLEDGFTTSPAEIKVIKFTETNSWFEVTLYEGHNQQIRKMFDNIGHSVIKLRRIKIGNLTIAGLPLGKHRILTADELHSLYSYRKTDASGKKARYSTSKQRS
jgi:23S rRNA pseudouridine2605 synthase